MKDKKNMLNVEAHLVNSLGTVSDFFECLQMLLNLVYPLRIICSYLVLL